MILFVWMLHWLASKRTKGLIGEESKSVFNHARLLLLYVFLCLFDGAITYVFTQQFFKYGNKINDIYVEKNVDYFGKFGLNLGDFWLKNLENSYKLFLILLVDINQKNLDNKQD